MESDDSQAIVAGLEAVRSEFAELKDLMRALLGAVEKLDTSTSDAATKITAAIQRWT